MPIICCPECGREVDTSATICPHCGYRRYKEAPKATPTVNHCARCGMEYGLDYSACPHCGHRPGPLAPAPSTPIEDQAPVELKMNYKHWVIALASIFAIIFIFIVSSDNSAAQRSIAPVHPSSSAGFPSPAASTVPAQARFDYDSFKASISQSAQSIHENTRYIVDMLQYMAMWRLSYNHNGGKERDYTIATEHALENAFERHQVNITDLENARAVIEAQYDEICSTPNMSQGAMDILFPYMTIYDSYIEMYNAAISPKITTKTDIRDLYSSYLEDYNFAYSELIDLLAKK